VHAPTVDVMVEVFAWLWFDICLYNVSIYRIAFYGVICLRPCVYSICSYFEMTVNAAMSFVVCCEVCVVL
jgi:hypothetical protein